MSESLPASAGSDSSDADRAARIEQLLLSGLDSYFAGQYQQAINIWTRVVFLERGHSRARAYIERARSAMAERQRECEELVHHGVAAYNAGDVATARDLLTKAVDQGGASDTALLFLDRLNRVPSVPVREASPRPGTNRAPVATRVAPSPAAPTPWLPTILTSAAVAAAVVLGTLSMVSWWIDPAAAPAAAPERVVAEPLPVVRTSEIALARARSLFADGHLRDALRTLDGIALADPVRPEADRLRGEVQRALLATLPPADADGGARP